MNKCADRNVEVRTFEIMTRQTNHQQTNLQTDMRPFKEVTLLIIMTNDLHETVLIHKL